MNTASVQIVPACGPPGVPYGGSYQCAVGVIYYLGVANGAITYSYDHAAPVTVPLNPFGVATFVLTKPALGSHQIVLNYAAQGNFGAASPVTIPFNVVVAPVSVGLKASTQSTTSGKPVTFTATVTSPQRRAAIHRDRVVLQRLPRCSAPHQSIRVELQATQPAPCRLAMTI